MKPPQQGDQKLENLTRDELKKIERSMKRPEFMGLLNEYMVQISDPKNKAEYDQYLKQMEQEGQLPKHMKLVEIEPEFCFRTHIISNKNKKHEMKFFVNMCSSKYIDKPSCEPASGEDGQGGYSWKIPNSMGKIRYDQDVHKNPCQVVDCAFHPDTFKFAGHASFQAMMISIALQSTQKQLGQRKQSLSRDYVILKKIKCKGENNKPALLPIRFIEGKAYNRGEGPAQLQRDLEGKQTKLQKEINQQKQEYQKQKKLKQKQKKLTEKQEEIEEDLDDEPKKKLVEDLEVGVHAPKYSTIYTYKTQYADFLEESTPKARRKLPSQFSVQFKVPRMEAISEASKLEINENKILFEVTDKYYIDLAFDTLKEKYPLRTNEAKAKFDKKKKILKVQIPVDESKLEDDMIQTQLIREEPSGQQPTEYIENQTWKNKVLQIPEESVKTKFITEDEMQQKTQEKKLIEEIDEDDYVEGEQIKEKQNEHYYELQAFSLKKYYEQDSSNIKIAEGGSISYQPLSFIFSQNKKQIIMMVRMPNYAHDQTDSCYHIDEKIAEIMIKWSQVLKHEVLGLHIQVEQKQPKINKVNIVKRVGFHVICIQKDRNQNWGKESIKDHSRVYLKEGIQKFEYEFSDLKRKMEDRQQKEREAEQQKQIEAQKQKVNQETKVQEQRVQLKQQKVDNSSQITKKMQQLDNDIEKGDRIISNQIQKQQKGNNIIFDKLPFQFINFKVSFVDVLN